MANKQALRELHARLAERLHAARTQVRSQSWLAVECSGRGFLFPLCEAGEISAPVRMEPVPHSCPWFLGVSNLRGHLHGVVDLGRFFGLPRLQAARDTARLVGFNPSLHINCVMRVDRLAGLRSDDDLTREPDSVVPLPAFVGARLRDGSGRVWQALSLTELAGNDAFLKIVG